MKETWPEKHKHPCYTLYPTWFRWKHTWRWWLFPLPSLYIPHGSDERNDAALIFEHCGAALYPTWFRWKFFADLLARVSYLALYPTWFRWKSISHCIEPVFLNTLYPTWFRWKQRTTQLFVSQHIFISHMVQMKAELIEIKGFTDKIFISHMVQMKGRLRNCCAGFQIKSLYPTWFRWKLKIRPFINVISTLYPTWFRWKFKF